jgi:hypothetical protein
MQPFPLIPIISHIFPHIFMSSLDIAFSIFSYMRRAPVESGWRGRGEDGGRVSLDYE